MFSPSPPPRARLMPVVGWPAIASMFLAAPRILREVAGQHEARRSGDRA